MKIVFASNNPNKVAEMKQALGDGFELLSLGDIGFEGEIPETGETLEHNAEEKARYIFDRFQIPVFADDTGLEIEALDGKPGVHTAHYSGIRDAERNMAKVLSEMKDASSRKARFRTVISFVSKERSELFEGIVDGEIATELSGAKGFGYDPIFKPEGQPRTFADMGMEEKAKTNHRVRALAKLEAFVKQLRK
jgi:XTP/dITP diphosphohydrolase